MDRLREDYRDGERFYANEMNQLTHVVNSLGDQVSQLEEKVDEDKIQILRELPEKGEEGIIYSIPKEGTYEKEYIAIKRKDDLFFPIPGGGIDYEGREFKVGDIIKIVNSAETSIVVNSVDENELSFDENTGINGITQWRTVENDCTYEITNIYRVTDIPLEAAMQNFELYVLTFTKVNTELYNFVLEDIPSFYLYVEVDPSSQRISYTLGLNEGVFEPGRPYIPIEYEVGDIVRFTGTGTTDIIPTEVDETNLIITDEGNLNGILSYSNPQTDACYEVTGVYDLKNPAEDLPDDIITVLKLFTFRKVSQQAIVDYEVELMASVYQNSFLKEIDSKSEYFWTGDQYEILGGGGNVSSESITKMWVGTQNEYDNLDSHESDTLYIIKG